MLQNNQRFPKICAVRHLADPMQNVTKVYAGACLITLEIHTRIVGQNVQWIQIVLVSKLASIKTAWILAQTHAVVMHVVTLLITFQCAVVHLVTLEIHFFYADHIYQMVSLQLYFIRIYM